MTELTLNFNKRLYVEEVISYLTMQQVNRYKKCLDKVLNNCGSLTAIESFMYLKLKQRLSK